MSYTPAYNARFIKPLLNQLIALIQRDQASAIAVVNPNLAPIAEFHKGPALRTAFPWLMVVGAAVAFDREAQFYTRHATGRLDLLLEVGQFDQELAQDLANDYARVLDIIVTTATSADWETPLAINHETVPSGTTSPNAAGSVKEVFVAGHSYDIVRAPQIEIPVLRVTLSLLVELEET